MPLIATHELTSPSDDPQIYNGFDVCRTHGILDKLLLLPGADPVYTFSRAMQGPAMEMMLRGFLIDPMERDRGITDIKARLKGINEFLAHIVHAICGQTTGFIEPPFFFNSGPQIRHVLYDVMRIKPLEKHFRGETKYPMDEETLEKIRLRFPKARPVASAILALRDLKKQLERLEMEVDPDWRIRTSFNIAGTNEGRWSSSKSFTGTGGNLQNVSADLRRMFISDPGYKLCGIDKEQAESRQVGVLCGILFDDWTYLNMCESGDCHTSVARMVWPELAWTGDLKRDRKLAEEPFYQETRRQSCKILGHGTNYLGTPPTMSVHTGIPVKAVQEFQDRYFTALPAIPQLHRWVAWKLERDQFLVNLFGCRRDFFDRPESPETHRQGMAYLGASGNAYDINLGLYRMWINMSDKIQLLTQEHDAVYFQFSEDWDEQAIIDEAQAYLNVKIPLTATRSFSVSTEAKTGWNKGNRWAQDKHGQLIEVNPKGLDKPGATR